MDFNNRIWLVTGANSGIGLAITNQILSDGKDVVVAVDKDQEELEKLALANYKIVPERCDLQQVDQIRELFEKIQHHPKLGRVDVLVNNAGRGGCKGILDMSPEDFVSMTQVNLIAPTVCSQMAIENMPMEGNGGHIVNILSVWAWTVPSREYTHYYSATKHALKTVAECIRIEASSRKLKVKVTNISPGPVETNFNYNSVQNKEEAEKIYGGIKSYIRLTSEEVAEAVINAVNSPNNVQVNEVVLTPSGYVTC